MPTGAGLRPGAKAPAEPPDPTGGAPALDPTDERRLETKPQRGVRHRNWRKPPETATPSAYRHRASRRLYSNLVGTLNQNKGKVAQSRRDGALRTRQLASLEASFNDGILGRSDTVISIPVEVFVASVGVVPCVGNFLNRRIAPR